MIPGKMKHLQKLLIILLNGIIVSAVITYRSAASPLTELKNSNIELLQVPVQEEDQTGTLGQLNELLKNSLISGNYNEGIAIYKRIMTYAAGRNLNDSIQYSNSLYYSGTLFLFLNDYSSAINLLEQAVRIRTSELIFDEIYLKCFSNLGIGYYRDGDNIKAADNIYKAVEIGKSIYGDNSSGLIAEYGSLVSVYIEASNYEEAIKAGEVGLALTDKYSDSVSPYDIFVLLHGIGIAYSRTQDYSKAQLYLENALVFFETELAKEGDNYINLLNSLGASYFNSGQPEKAFGYYEMGLKAIGSEISSLTLNFINSYSILLGEEELTEKGEVQLLKAVTQAKLKFGSDSREYNTVLKNYASYLDDYVKNHEKAIAYFSECLNYVRKNEQDINLKDDILTGYALALSNAGRYNEALEKIQEVLISGVVTTQGIAIFDNPPLSDLKANKRTLNNVSVKYKILRNMFEKTYDLDVLKSTAKTAELLISILEQVRINISEEESRMILGDNYRELYVNAIRDYESVYKITGQRVFLEKAFEYSERSKVAGLLASTREMKATEFNVPAVISDLERDLQRKIGSYRELISKENSGNNPDLNKIRIWNQYVLDATQQRDSLVKVFEERYPEYYKIKYNTDVLSINEISKIGGRRDNFLSYVISDTTLYTFLVNDKYQKLYKTSLSASFYDNIEEFRKLLSNPSDSKSARTDFIMFRKVGYELYKTLIEPFMEFMTSDRLIISPDNILSYLPFETLLTDNSIKNDMLYRDLPYLLHDYDITYTYSATLLSESMSRDRSISNRLIAFAPRYNKSLSIDSIITSRQAVQGVLRDLPYAREEAMYVAGKFNSSLFINEDATESAFKASAGDYDIIHMAMHTLLYDKEPMYSKMLFSADDSGKDDNQLNTYEIYNIPLKAKMVVLSSCNTGIGFFRSGEGVISLARGFIYSGSESVVMSMWEVEDKSGTSLVKLFYDNLHSGDSKSIALRKARRSYLKEADQLRSHPYFWATLIVYGNNSPIYFSKIRIIVSLMSVIIVAGLIVYYLRKL